MPHTAVLSDLDSYSRIDHINNQYTLTIVTIREETTVGIFRALPDALLYNFDFMSLPVMPGNLSIADRDRFLWICEKRNYIMAVPGAEDTVNKNKSK